MKRLILLWLLMCFVATVPAQQKRTTATKARTTQKSQARKPAAKKTTKKSGAKNFRRRKPIAEGEGAGFQRERPRKKPDKRKKNSLAR